MGVFSDDFAAVDVREELCYHSRPKKQIREVIFASIFRNNRARKRIRTPIKYQGSYAHRLAQRGIFFGCASKASSAETGVCSFVRRAAPPPTLCAMAKNAIASKHFLRMSGARTSVKTDFLISLLRATKKPAKRRVFMAQRRGFEPPDESPPSHDFQSCSLNHSDISAKTSAILQQTRGKSNCF